MDDTNDSLISDWLMKRMIDNIYRFPRIAVNHEKMIREKLDERAASARLNPKPTTNIVKVTHL